MYLDASSVIAVALVALVLIFIRISWTLKDIHEAIVAKVGNASAPKSASPKASAESKASAADAASDEAEIAAVIAIAHAAFRAAV